jgi:uncharacterized protein YbaR (Trm112 family)
MTEPRKDPDLQSLACPACKGLLRAEGSRILCQSCALIYPIVDGIPVLIAARATKNN